MGEQLPQWREEEVRRWNSGGLVLVETDAFAPGPEPSEAFPRAN